MNRRIRRYSAPRRLLPQVRRLLGLCSLEAWRQSPARLRLICIPSAVSSALRKVNKILVQLFHPDIFSKNKSQHFLGKHDFANRGFQFCETQGLLFAPALFFIYLWTASATSAVGRIAMTYKQITVAVFLLPNYTRSVFLLQLLHFCDLFVRKHVVTSDVFCNQWRNRGFRLWY